MSQCSESSRIFPDDIFGNHSDAFAAYLAPWHDADRVVYAKRPFAGPDAVLAYLSRYTHRVAISNSRPIGLDDNKVTFKDKDYRAKDGDMQKTMALPIAEFIRRFLTHVLPSGPLMFRTYVALSSASYVLGRFEEGLAYARKAAKLNHTALCQQRASREPGTSAPVARHAGPRRRGRRQPNRRWVLNPLASLPHKSIAAVDSRLGIFRLVTERAQRSARNSRLDSGIQPP